MSKNKNNKCHQRLDSRNLSPLKENKKTKTSHDGAVQQEFSRRSAQTAASPSLRLAEMARAAGFQEGPLRRQAQAVHLTDSDAMVRGAEGEGRGDELAALNIEHWEVGRRKRFS